MELTIALVAAGTSLFVAIISVISSIVSNRQAARLAREIESLKHTLAKEEAAQVISDEQFNESIRSLQLFIQVIQRMKDELQLILGAEESGLEPKRAIERIIEARKAIFDCYEAQMAFLEERETSTSHQAKNQAILIEQTIKKYQQEKPFILSLSTEQKETLLRFRTELTDLQNLLRDSRTERVARRTLHAQLP
jgi:hypothetical protein